MKEKTNERTNKQNRNSYMKQNQCLCWVASKSQLRYQILQLVLKFLKDELL